MVNRARQRYYALRYTDTEGDLRTVFFATEAGARAFYKVSTGMEDARILAFEVPSPAALLALPVNQIVVAMLRCLGGPTEQSRHCVRVIPLGKKEKTSDHQ